MSFWVRASCSAWCHPHAVLLWNDDLTPTDNPVSHVYMTKHTFRFYTVFTNPSYIHIANSLTVYFTPDCCEQNRTMTSPLFSLSSPRYLPNFTAAARHGEPYLHTYPSHQLTISTCLFKHTYFIHNHTEAPTDYIPISTAAPKHTRTLQQTIYHPF